MDRKISFTVNKSLFLLAFTLAACGGGNDFVGDQHSTFDGGISAEGTPALDGNPDNRGSASKYPFASGIFANCYNAEANGECTISPDTSVPLPQLSSSFTPSDGFFERFYLFNDGRLVVDRNGRPVFNESAWFRVIPYDKSLILPTFDRNRDQHYSYEYLNGTFDGLTNAVNRSVIGKDGKGNQSYADFGKLNGYFAGNDLMLVRDVDQWGFQTIAHLVKFNNKRQIVDDVFASIGQPLREISGLTEATYHGIATGSLNRRSDTFADVSAQLKTSGTGTYQLLLNVSNTQITPNNLTSAGFTNNHAAPELDFTRTLSWNSETREFRDSKKGTVTARIYGPEGQEVGGIFSGTTTGYQGAYGAKR